MTDSTDRGSSASITIDNAIDEMAKVVDLVEAFGAAHDIPQAIRNDLNLCLDELLNNTISYGYDDEGHHGIVVTLSLTDGRLMAQIQDDARPFDPRQATPVPEGSLRSRQVGGVGLHFVKTLMDEVGYVRVGPRNVVTIAKKY